MPNIRVLGLLMIESCSPPLEADLTGFINDDSFD